MRKFYVSGFSDKKGTFRITRITHGIIGDDETYNIELGPNNGAWCNPVFSKLQFRDDTGKPMSAQSVYHAMKEQEDA